MSAGELRASALTAGDPADLAEDDALVLIRMGATPKLSLLYTTADLRDYLATPGTDNTTPLGTNLKRFSDVRAMQAHIDGPVTLAGAPVTVSTPILALSQTWNGAAIVFEAITLDVTDTASGAAALLANLKVGGVTKFKIGKDGKVTATTFVGALTGNADTATAAGTATLAAAATQLATPRTINGVAFDGTGNITVGAAAATLTGDTLVATVVHSSLTDFGTVSALTLGALAAGQGVLNGGGSLTVADASCNAKTRIFALYASNAPAAALYATVTNGVGFTIVGTVGQTVSWLRIQVP